MKIPHWNQKQHKKQKTKNPGEKKKNTATSGVPHKPKLGSKKASQVKGGGGGANGSLERSVCHSFRWMGLCSLSFFFFFFPGGGGVLLV